MPNLSPLRVIATALSDSELEQIDRLREGDPGKPSRAEIIRQAVDLYLHINALPVETFEVIRTAVRSLAEVEAKASDRGEQ